MTSVEQKSEDDQVETDNPSNSSLLSPPLAYKARIRFNSSKTPTFEGIDEENEDLSSNSSVDAVVKESNHNNSKTDETDAKSLKSIDQTEPETPKRNKRISESSSEDVEVNQRSILKTANKNRPTLGRHLSFDSQLPNNTIGSQPNISIKAEDDKDAVDKYYERNNYTITGIYEKNQDTFRNLPDYLRREQNRRQSTSQKSMSRCSYAKPEPISGYHAKKRFRKSFYFLLHNRKRIGFRHMFLLMAVLAYTIFGGFVFYYIEGRNELETVTARKAYLDDTIMKMASEMTDRINDPLIFVNDTLMEEYLRSAYIKLLSLESAYEGSTLYKAEDPENNFKWTFASAFFFSMNVYTTTGYGSIAPTTTEGKVCTIIYGFIFVPLTLVVIRDLGQLALVYCTKIYAIIIFKLKTARGYADGKDDDIISLPIKFCLSILAGYLMFASLFVYEYDALSGPPGSGIDFFNSFYFSFISITTIGLGDIMPNNVPFTPLISIIFFLGLPLMKVVNRVTYVCLENGVFATMTVMENRLDQLLGNDTSIQLDAERGRVSRAPSIQVQQPAADGRSSASGLQDGGADSSDNEGEIPNEWINNFTIRSIATFMRSSGDVYGGGFGRVNLRRADILPCNNQDTVRSSIQ
ncbi:unnamed protein product [Auanema sp. JU1783]|nr:unnamed protein product [Auanema sp. JU1783]